jgi:hypothetical protein
MLIYVGRSGNTGAVGVSYISDGRYVYPTGDVRVGALHWMNYVART